MLFLNILAEWTGETVTNYQLVARGRSRAAVPRLGVLKCSLRETGLNHSARAINNALVVADTRFEG